jgi:hypothetical protein
VSRFQIDNINAACARRHPLNPVRWLLRAGIARPHHSGQGLRWPLSWCRWHMWVYLWRSPGQRIGAFRNGEFVRDVGTWLPRRWGFHVLGLEIGQRG